MGLEVLGKLPVQSLTLMSSLSDSRYSVNAYPGIHQADIFSVNHLSFQEKLPSFEMTLEPNGYLLFLRNPDSDICMEIAQIANHILSSLM